MQMRWMIKRDMEEVEQIERLSFSQPWNSDDFIAALRRRNVVGQVLEVDEELIVGFVIYELHKHSLRIVNIAVHPDDRRVGAARRMVKRLTEKLNCSNRSLVSVEIRETNLAAQLFFKSAGFWCEAILKGQYEGTTDDSYCFVFRKPVDEYGEPVDCDGEE